MNHSEEPKYVQLKEYIKEFIHNGHLKQDDKVFSEYELTEQFGVSRHTVRKAISDLTNEGWLYTVQGKGTFVADPTAYLNQPTKSIGVVTTYLKDYIFPEIIHGIDKVLVEHGYNIILGTTNNQVEREKICLTNMLGSNLSGLIIEPTKSALPNPNAELLEEFNKRNIPVLFIHGYYQNYEASYIIEDDIYAGYIATKHLIELGHTKIAGIFKSDDIQGHGRYQGFVKAHREKDISITETAIQWYTTEDLKNLFQDTGYGEMIQKRIGNCSSLVCYNDQVALRLLELLKSKDLQVPNQLSIVSFDNSRLAQMTDINLTSVAHPKTELGIKAAQALLVMLNNSAYSIQEMIKPELIVRDSTIKIEG